jgi:hypothetical protein
MTAVPCVVSVADHAGWSHLVCVAAAKRVPVVIGRQRVATIDDGLPTMPYHHESLRMDVDAADALIARVRRSIAECTSRALRGVVDGLAPAYRVVALAIREPTFPELPPAVAVVRQSYQLQCAADGMMYQLAMCDAARGLGIDVQQCRRGEETALAAARLDVPVSEVEGFVGSRGRPSGPPWTEEHRRAFAAGIAALAGRSDRPRRLRLR